MVDNERIINRRIKIKVAGRERREGLIGLLKYIPKLTKLELLKRIDICDKCIETALCHGEFENGPFEYPEWLTMKELLIEELKLRPLAEKGEKEE